MLSSFECPIFKWLSLEIGPNVMIFWGSSIDWSSLVIIGPTLEISPNALLSIGTRIIDHEELTEEMQHEISYNLFSICSMRIFVPALQQLISS